MSRFLNPREQKIFFACIATLVVLGAYNGVIVPFQEMGKEIEGEIHIQKSTLEAHRAVIAKAESLKSRRSMYERMFGKAGTREQIASGILTELEAVAGQLNLKIADVKPGKIEDFDADHRFSVQLSFNAALADIVHFLYTIQQSPHYFDIEKADFVKNSRRNEEGLNATLVLGKSFIRVDDGSSVGGNL